MRVLVTRARDDAERTASLLVAAGHVAIVSPLIEIVATNAVPPEAPVDAILATSVHALRGIERLPAALAGAPWLVVGERLATALRARGFGEAEAVAADVADLIAMLAERYPEPFRFLYLAGRDRKPELERALAAANHSVIVAEIYAAKAVERLEPHAEIALRDGGIDAVFHYSRRSADLFVASLRRSNIEAQALRHVAISADAAVPLSEREWAYSIARSPDESSMIAALSRVSK